MAPQDMGQPRPQNPLKPFSLTPAIFTPFTGLPPEPPRPLERSEKLRNLLESLEPQQENVRRNMIHMIEKEAKRLCAEAQEELDLLERSGQNKVAREVELEMKRKVKRSLEDMMTKIRVPARKDAGPGAYEFQRGRLDLRDSGGDIQMGNTELHNSKPRTATTIQAELSRRLEELVDQGVAELETYDVHADKVVMEYRQALEREKARSGNENASGVRSGFPPPSAPQPVGILRNRHEESPVDMEALRRMSSVQPVRTTENYEQLRRRNK